MGGNYFAAAGSELHLLVCRGFGVMGYTLLVHLCQESGTPHVEQLAGLVSTKD